MEPDISKEEYIEALKKMKKSPASVVGILGDLVVTGIGTTAGVGVAGKIAAAFGATTLLGSTKLAIILGTTFVTTTPIGWVIGSAAAAGVLAFGTGRLIRSGAKTDTIKKYTIREIERRISKL